MTAKEYLRQIERLDIKIRQKEEQLECLRETAGGSAAIRYDKINVQMQPSKDMMEKNVLMLMELEEKILTDKVRLNIIKDYIIDQIHGLEDKRYIDILYKRYVKYERFEQIALDMSYDYVYLRALHGEALGMFELKYENDLHNLTQSYKKVC